ncbi:MAG TPA: class I SAM-dependent methyltransferase [Acidimicrobiales bacterium]|nr:class I SAM-dependent methyltransferase [Acidimicrobiales bacterium]
MQDRVLAARRAVVRALGRLEKAAGAARHRLEAGPGRPGGDDRSIAGPGEGRYGQLWDPPADSDAMALILNTTDTEEFERTGRADAERLRAFLPQDGTALDVGCGIGRVARYLAPHCATLWAVDASPRMLELARERLREVPNVRFARCVDTDIPDVPTASVDLVYALLVLQHLEREDAFLLLEELRRVLKPGGTLFVTFPNLLSDTYLSAFLEYARRGETANPARARMYTPQEVARILPAAGFDADIEADVEIVAVCHPR